MEMKAGMMGVLNGYLDAMGIIQLLVIHIKCLFLSSIHLETTF